MSIQLELTAALQPLTEKVIWAYIRKTGRIDIQQFQTENPDELRMVING